MKKNKQHIGLSPDDLIFRGVKKTDEVVIRLIDFNVNNLTEEEVKDIKSISDYQHKETVTWVNIDGLHSTRILEEITAAFNLDTLAIAEVLNIDSRSRVIEYDNCILLTIKMLLIDEKTFKPIVENLSIVLTKNILFSFQERKGDVFDPIRERIRKHKKRIRNGSTDFLAFALLDIVVDNYLYVISTLGEKIENLEEELLLEPDQSIINQINTCKRELNFLRKNIKPSRDMMFSLKKTEYDLITESSHIHFQELQENISQANESIEHYREILSDYLNIYHTSISNKLNDIMKFLTVFSSIFIPLTFIVGIYGTNFVNIPEIKYKNSYFIMWFVMIGIAIGMILFFKKKRWF